MKIKKNILKTTKIAMFFSSIFVFTLPVLSSRASASSNENNSFGVKKTSHYFSRPLSMNKNFTVNQKQSFNKQANEKDKTFIEMMIPHHKAAIEMANIALERSGNNEVRALAEGVVQDQTKEIAEMSTLYKKLFGTEVKETNLPSMMDSKEMSEKLRTSEDFDNEFLNMMADHHKTAIDMAGKEVSEGENNKVMKIAKNVIVKQKNELQEISEIKSHMD